MIVPGSSNLLPAVIESGDPLDELGEITRSLRLRRAASGSLSRTPALAGNRKTWVMSCHVKRGSLGVYDTIYGTNGDSQNLKTLRFETDDTFLLYEIAANVTQYSVKSTAKFRDPSGHYHFTVGFDSTQPVAADRVRVWVNGVSLPMTHITPVPLNFDSFVNSAAEQFIGKAVGASTYYLDGYLSHLTLIDGYPTGITQGNWAASNLASLFGQFHALTGQWRPHSEAAIKSLADAGGVNSFFLPFSDPTSLTTLTADASAKGNNWTATNVSLTTGETYDSMLDTPTNNYATLNALRNGATLASGALTLSGGGPAHGTVAIPQTTPVYFEAVTMQSASASNGIGIGVARTSIPITTAHTGGGAGVIGFYASAAANLLSESGGVMVINGLPIAGDVLQVAVSWPNLWVGRNNVWLDGTGGPSGNPVTGANPTFVLSSEHDYTPHVVVGGVTSHVNFGQRPFAYTPPPGFKALCTKNLPRPVAESPRSHFDVALHTGSTAAPVSVTGKKFKPDLVWTKARNQPGGLDRDHNVVDSVRGLTSNLFTNKTVSADTAQRIQSLDAEGVTFAPNFPNTSLDGGSYVSWLWRAGGGGAVANNAGSIPSQVSANPVAGFSVVTYTGTGANATVGHGLGAAPDLVIAKCRAGSDVDHWPVWHRGLLSQDYTVYLNLTNGQVSTPTMWASALPTSDVFSVGTADANRAAGYTYVAYCFATVPGYSRFGSYIGNGSTDGPFVWCGFSPRWLMIKRADSVASWIMIDTERGSANAIPSYLQADLIGAELSDNSFDAVGSGFKCRAAGNLTNTSGGTYIYAAFAEFPFRYANAR